MARTPKPYSPRRERFARRWTRFTGRVRMWVYRKTNGRLGGGKRMPVCLFTTTGRRTGLARTVPLVYLEDGEQVIVVAAQGGLSTNPDWYLNIVANPRVTVESQGDARAMLARTATAAEKAVWWPRLVETDKAFATFQQRTTRDIPVVVCTPGV